jgi:hypothetical protein
VAFLDPQKQKRPVQVVMPRRHWSFNITRPLLYVAKITVTFSSRQQILRENLFFDDSKQSDKFLVTSLWFLVSPHSN